VQDTGCGMSERVQARIFEPFFTTKFQGRGMGLAAAYGIVDNHGGCISVSSQEGEGSTLKVWLPAFAESVTGYPSPAPQDTAMVSTPAATILVAEDDTSVRQLIVRVVRRLGCDVLEAHNGLEAVDIARTYDNEIHLAILDMGMPGLSGPETYPFLVEVRPEIKVILCSGYEMDETTQALLNAGASGFVSKPFQMSALEQEIRKVLTNRGQN